MTAIWLVDATGSRLEMVVDANPGHSSQFGQHADVSPDGTQLVYASCEFSHVYIGDRDRTNYNYEIAATPLDGTGQRWLTRNTHIDHYPVWSPDGSRIAFLSAFGQRGNDDESLGLYTMAAARTVAKQVAPPGQYGLTLAPPVWSPDGDRLAFLANAEHVTGYRRNLYSVKADGAEMTLLAEEVVSGPAWSPDGGHLAVAKY